MYVAIASHLYCQQSVHFSSVTVLQSESISAVYSVIDMHHRKTNNFRKLPSYFRFDTPNEITFTLLALGTFLSAKKEMVNQITFQNH